MSPDRHTPIEVFCQETDLCQAIETLEIINFLGTKEVNR